MSTKPTLTLFRGWTTPNEIVWSPFVTKVEFRLRHASIPYTTEAGSLSRSPKGKIPYMTVTHGTTTDTFSDSTLIVQRLVRDGHLPDLNGRLSPEQKLADLAVRSLLEDRLYFYGMRERWITNHYVHRDHILGQMALPVRALVGWMIYRSTATTLHGQGTGRFSDEEIDAFRVEIWGAIEDRLAVVRERSGKEVFWVLGGEEPTEADASLFSFIVSVLVARSCPRSQEVVKACPAVMDYVDRIFSRYFAEYKRWDN